MYVQSNGTLIHSYATNRIKSCSEAGERSLPYATQKSVYIRWADLYVLFEIAAKLASHGFLVMFSYLQISSLVEWELAASTGLEELGLAAAEHWELFSGVPVHEYEKLHLLLHLGPLVHALPAVYSHGMPGKNEGILVGAWCLYTYSFSLW